MTVFISLESAGGVLAVARLVAQLFLVRSLESAIAKRVRLLWLALRVLGEAARVLGGALLPRRFPWRRLEVFRTAQGRVPGILAREAVDALVFGP